MRLSRRPDGNLAAVFEAQEEVLEFRRREAFVFDADDFDDIAGVQMQLFLLSPDVQDG